MNQPNPTLIEALQSGAIASIQATLDQRPKAVKTFLPIKQPWGDEQWMPLHIAAAVGQTEVVGLLLSRGVQTDCRTRFVTPMHARQTPLHLASAAGHLTVVDQLLDAGAEVEVRDAVGRSPLWSASRHLHTQVVERLIGADAMVNAPDRQGRTPLHAGLLPMDSTTITGKKESDEQRLAIVDLLLQEGADPNAICPKDPEGFTPLHRCMALDQNPCIEMIYQRLLKAGADADLRDPRFGRRAGDRLDSR
jgi:ankyrin repeat protein